MENRLVTTFIALLLGGLLPAVPAFTQEGGRRGGLRNNLDLPFEAGGKDEEEEEPPEIVVFYGQQYEGDGIFFCCDRSGSMNDAGEFRRLQSEVIKNIQQFSERVQFSIVLFDRNLQKFPASGKPAEANAAMKAAGSAWIMSQGPGKGSCTKPALLASLQFAMQSSARRKVIIYLSDGGQTCNDADPRQYGQQCLAEVTQRNTQRVHINTICIGPVGDVDENWMRKLAALNNGTYARIINK